MDLCAKCSCNPASHLPSCPETDNTNAAEWQDGYEAGADSSDLGEVSDYHNGKQDDSSTPTAYLLGFAQSWVDEFKLNNCPFCWKVLGLAHHLECPVVKATNLRKWKEGYLMAMFEHVPHPRGAGPREFTYPTSQAMMLGYKMEARFSRCLDI